MSDRRLSARAPTPDRSNAPGPQHRTGERVDGARPSARGPSPSRDCEPILVCHSPGVVFWDFMLAVPAPARLLISMALTIGISIALVRLLNQQLLTMSREDPGASDGRPSAPNSADLIGRFTPFIGVAFVFLAGVSVSQFWVNDRLATEALAGEAANYLRATTYAAQIGAGQGGDQIRAALDAYRASVEDDQWPLMQHSQARRAYELQVQASGAVQASMQEAGALGALKSPVWDDLTTAVDDMLIAGTDRIDSVPQTNALWLLVLVMALGIANLAVLALTCAYYRRLSRILIGVAAGATGLLMFVTVELCNPYIVGFYSLVIHAS